MRVHEDWLLTPQRTAVHVPTATAVVADLHLGYSEARRRGGEAVPCGDLETLLAPLGRALALHGVRSLVIAGDLFEAGYHEVLVAELRRWIQRTGVELLGLVPGNHDRGPRHDDGALPLLPQGTHVGDWHVVHGDGVLPTGPVIHGHFHPCLRLAGQVAAPCYLIGRRSIILPAYSADARGVNVLGTRPWQSHRCGVLVGDTVLDFGRVRSIRHVRRTFALNEETTAKKEWHGILQRGQEDP